MSVRMLLGVGLVFFVLCSFLVQQPVGARFQTTDKVGLPAALTPSISQSADQLVSSGIAAVILSTLCVGQEGAKQQAEANRQHRSSLAELYLEKLQRESAPSFGLPIQRRFNMPANVDSDVDFDRLIHETSRALNLTATEESEFRQRVIERKKRYETLKPQSQYENPELYLTLQLWSETIRSAARHNVKPSDRLDKTHVVFGTLPTGQVNAQALLVPSTRDEYLIVFQSGFFDFANLMALAFASTLPIERREHGYAVLSVDPVTVLDNVRQHPELQARFLQLIMAYLVEGRFDTLPAAYFSTGDTIRDGVATSLYKAMGLFVVGHEYGHILRGDLAGEGVASVLADQKIRRIPIESEQELGADELGIKLMYFAMKGARHNLTVIIVAADFFLLCYDIVERSASLIATGDVRRRLATEDHPPTSMRRVQIREKLQSFLLRYHAKEVSQSDWNTAVKDASKYGEIMEQLFLASQAPLKRLHERGVNLAPAWRHWFPASQ